MVLPHGCSPVWSPDGEYLWFYALNNVSALPDSFILPPDNSCFFPDENERLGALSRWGCVHHRTHVSFVHCTPVLYRLAVKKGQYEMILSINDSTDVDLAKTCLYQNGYHYGYDTYEALFTPCGRYIVCPILKWLGENPTNIEPRSGVFCFLDVEKKLMWTSPYNEMYIDEKNAWVSKSIHTENLW